MSGEFAMLGAAAAGMDAQRSALDIAARNVAAAQVAGPHDRFARLVPIFVTSSDADSSPERGAEARIARLDGISSSDFDSSSNGLGGASEAEFGDEIPIRVAGTRSEAGHDVDVVTEMVAVLDAQRKFEANASLFDAGKRLAERTIDMGRL